MKPPQNVYELLEQTAEAIEECGLNYYQTVWAAPVEHVTAGREGACGTAFCRAGWMINIAHGDKALSMSPYDWGRTHIADAAYAMLETAGCPIRECAELFSGGAVTQKYGTQAYNKAGAKGVRQFMERHRDKLKATPLVKGPRGVLVAVRQDVEG